MNQSTVLYLKAKRLTPTNSNALASLRQEVLACRTQIAKKNFNEMIIHENFMNLTNTDSNPELYGYN